MAAKWGRSLLQAHSAVRAGDILGVDRMNAVGDEIGREVPQARAGRVRAVVAEEENLQLGAGGGGGERGEAEKQNEKARLLRRTSPCCSERNIICCTLFRPLTFCYNNQLEQENKCER